MTAWICCRSRDSGINSLDALIELQRNHALAWWIEPGRVLVAWPVGGVGWLRVEGESVLKAVVAAREGRGVSLENVAERTEESPTKLETLLRESIEHARVNPAGGGR